MAIGEAPGMEEDETGRPFCGRSGKELNENYLRRMGWNRSEIYFTNTCKCRPDNNKTPSDSLRNSCGGHFLADEIRMVNPQLILLLGATASKIINRPIKLERDHGFPFKLAPGEGGLLGDYTGWVVCLYHPAAGMHNTSMMIPLLADADNINLWNKELWEPPVDQFPIREYELIDDINTFTRKFYTHLDTAVDTESDSNQQFWSAQFSQMPGTGYALMTRNTYLMQQFVDALTANSNLGGMFIAQNTIVDYAPLYNLGLRVNAHFIADTMQQAFQHGNCPQGLKSMSRRLVGVIMRDFESVVMPPSLRLLREWMDRVIILDSMMVSPKLSVVGGEIIREPRPGPLASKIKTFLKSFDTHVLNSDSKIFTKAHEWYAKNQVYKYGIEPPPRMGIEHVEFSEALYYMCQDPDITLRCHYRLNELAVESMTFGKYQREPDPWRCINFELMRPINVRAIG